MPAPTSPEIDIDVTSAAAAPSVVDAPAPATPPEPAPAGQDPTPPAADASADEEPIDKDLEDQADAPRPDETPQQKQTRLNRRIGGLKARITAEKRRAERLEQELTQLKAQIAPTTASAPQAPAAAQTSAPEPPETFTFPKWEQWSQQEGNDGKDFDDYMDARSEARDAWKESRRQAAERRRQQEAAAQAAQARAADIQRQWVARRDAFKAEHPEWDRVVATSTAPLSPEAESYVIESEHGPALLLHLAKHPAEAQRIADLPTRAAQLRALVAIESKLAEPPAPAATTPPAAPPPRPITDAPAPVSPVPGGAQPERTPAQAAKGTEDADAYLAARYPHLLNRR